MKNRKRDRRDIEAEVQKTLQGVDHVEKVKAKPFFFMRLQRRLEAQPAQKREPEVSSVFKAFLRPALMPLLVVISIGVGVLIGYKAPTISRAEATSALVEAYGLSGPDLTQYTLTSNK